MKKKDSEFALNFVRSKKKKEKFNKYNNHDAVLVKVTDGVQNFKEKPSGVLGSQKFFTTPVKNELQSVAVSDISLNLVCKESDCCQSLNVSVNSFSFQNYSTSFLREIFNEI
jgi:hypothetical protein